MKPCGQVWISLGSNLGPAPQIFERARAELERQPSLQLRAKSSLRRSAALGPGQPVFTNQILLLESALPPLTLLALCQAIERRTGRVRDGRRWSPRLLDLDLLQDSRGPVQTRRLQLPHPGLGRDYLRPLFEELQDHGSPLSP